MTSLKAVSPRGQFARRARGLTLVLAIAAALVLLVDSNTAAFADYADGMRTEQALTLPDAAKVWRKEAWQRDDFLAQIRLGDLYATAQSIGPSESRNAGFFDPVEAYVWYFLALRPNRDYRADDNMTAYDALASIRGSALNNAQQTYTSLTFEQRLDARARILYILSSRGAEGFLTLGRVHTTDMAPPRQKYTKVCERPCWLIRWYRWFLSWFSASYYPGPPHWTWVLSKSVNWNAPRPARYLANDDCYGLPVPPLPNDNQDDQDSFAPANGGRSANNAHADGQNAAPADNAQPPGDGGNGDVQQGAIAPNAAPFADASFGGLTPVFTPNNPEALTYFLIAQKLGHPLAGAYVSSLREAIRYYYYSDAGRIIGDAERRARYWTAPYEYYPGITAKGKLHSDESLPSLDERLALRRVREIPFPAILEALDFRGYGLRGRACGLPPVCLHRAVEQFQAALDLEPTGFLSPEQTVRLIQMAAVDGDAIAQDRLGIMYAKGVGVPQNFVRAEKWFIKAANQRFPDALFNLYILYRVGPNGVEPDEAKASSYAAQATAAGYQPARCELLDLLRQADNPGHDRPVGARR